MNNTTLHDRALEFLKSEINRHIMCGKFEETINTEFSKAKAKGHLIAAENLKYVLNLLEIYKVQSKYSNPAVVTSGMRPDIVCEGRR